MASNGSCPYMEWYERLDDHTAMRIHKAVSRMESGNFSGCKPIKDNDVKGVFEKTMDFGPGWRVYYGLDGKTIVLLLVGGNKQTQGRDIAAALGYWKDYKARKGQGQ